MPYMRPEKKLTISLTEIGNAIARAKTFTDDWQAELLEIILIPKVYEHWRRCNPNYPRIELKRHDGLPDIGLTRAQNEQRSREKAWREIAGYTLALAGTALAWNSVRDDYYGHSASSAWDGVRRETYHSFVETLRMFYHSYIQQKPLRHDWLENELKTWNMAILEDIQQPALIWIVPD